jgi:hypothetical protein
MSDPTTSPHHVGADRCRVVCHPTAAAADAGPGAPRPQPDGWNIGWNVEEVGGQDVMHAHCHLVPRYGDEAYAGRGMRWWLKQPENARFGADEEESGRA